MSDLAAAVAGLATLTVERATVGSSAVTGDVAELTAGVALHALSLAIARVVVRATTLVAGRSAGQATAIAATEAATTAAESTRGRGCATSRGAVALYHR